jgi:hypothetical protein
MEKPVEPSPNASGAEWRAYGLEMAEYAEWMAGHADESANGTSMNPAVRQRYGTA